MKIPTRTQHKSGGILLALLVIVLAVIIIGSVAYSIYKAIKNLKPRKIEPDDVTLVQWMNSASNEIATIVSTNGNLPATGALSDGTYVVTVSDATTNLPRVIVERSTNLVHWERIAILVPSQLSSFVDTNPPYPNGFYRTKHE